MEAKEYDLEPLIAAITALDWSFDHPRQAMKAIQATIFNGTGDELSDIDALKLLARLVEHRFIRTRIDPPVEVEETGWRIRPGRAKYVRVPEHER